MYVQPVLHVPTATAALLLDGTLKCNGSVVRWVANERIHSFLKEVDLPAPEATSKALVARLTSASKGKSALVLAGTGVVLVGGVFAGTYVKKKRAAVRAIAAEDMPGCVTNFEASLRAYVDAARVAALDVAVLDALIVDLDAVKAFMEEGNEVLISLDSLLPLFDLVIAHTPRLAAASGIDLGELDEDDSEGGGIVPLRRHLVAQKTILAEAA
ncbi:hypothetical protein HG717_34995 [Rhodococcus erythropolis]|uniref:hypothetical protein n=1 Tax=Rhodococcus TaxID=1827 RepID=UPI0015F61631|nr:MULTISPECIES: hypothetical protein [Rhodococcus]MBY6389076.1 hypothetical protein [Rhodococcus erythropolis]